MRDDMRVQSGMLSAASLPHLAPLFRHSRGMMALLEPGSQLNGGLLRAQGLVPQTSIDWVYQLCLNEGCDARFSSRGLRHADSTQSMRPPTSWSTVKTKQETEHHCGNGKVPRLTLAASGKASGNHRWVMGKPVRCSSTLSGNSCQFSTLAGYFRLLASTWVLPEEVRLTLGACNLRNSSSARFRKPAQPKLQRV